MSNNPGNMNCAGKAAAIQEVYEIIDGIASSPVGEMDSASVEDLERDILKITDKLAALVLGIRLQTQLDSEQCKKDEKELINALPGKLRYEGLQEVNIRTVGGILITLTLRYYRRRCDKKAGKHHKGVYPGMLLLGLDERCTPLLASRISAWSALLSSFSEVRQVLFENGTVLGVKVIRRIAYAYAERARRHQEQCPLEFDSDDTLSGRRVVISCDGGRVRLREKKRGPRTKKGRSRYNGAWREPKLLIIYVVDKSGKQEKKFAPIIDGCLQGPDALFVQIKRYLQAMNITQADKVLFVADGAHWIWNRVDDLRTALGLNHSQTHELIDFYHAVEHLNKIANLRHSWDTAERKKWAKKQRRRLLKGIVEPVMEAIEELCRGSRGRNSKAIKTERDYFIRNRERMNYAEMKEQGLPIGSGAIESGVRRIINLRIKGPCIFWHKENAEKILMLRAYFKAGRWNMLKYMANSVRIFTAA